MAENPASRNRDAAERDVDELIRWELSDDGVVHAAIDAPDQANSLTSAMRDRLAARFEEASGDLRIRVVVLRGAGDRHFCTGANLGGPQKPSPPRPPGAPARSVGEIARTIQAGWQRLIASILDCDKPVVAAINGTAAGGGAHLALACDLTVMSAGAKLIEVFVRRGILPDAGGCYLLPRIVGIHRAKELMFLGGDTSAAEAERIGLVNRVAPPEEFDAAVEGLVGRFLELPTVAIAMTKRMLNHSVETSRQVAFEEEAWFQEVINTSTDFQEGLTAFRERRAPTFRGW